MSTNYEDLLAQIKTTLEAVSNVGKVYDYERYIKDEATLKNLFGTTISDQYQLRGWTITSPAMAEEREAAYGLHQRTLDFVLRGYLGVDDNNASEKTARILAETVCDAFSTNPFLGGVAFGAEPAQLEQFEYRRFGNVLCHYIEIKLQCRLRKQFTYQ